MSPGRKGEGEGEERERCQINGSTYYRNPVPRGSTVLVLRSHFLTRGWVVFTAGSAMRRAREEVIGMSYVAAGSVVRRAGSSVVGRQYGIPCRPGQGLWTRGRLVQISCTGAMPQCSLRGVEPSLPGVVLGYPRWLERLKIRRSRRGRRVAGIKWNQMMRARGAKIPQVKGTVLPPSRPTCLVGPGRVFKN